MALGAIAGIGSEAMLQAARELGVEAMVSDRVSLWRLRQSNPLRKGSGGRKKLDVEEARSLVLVSCHLAQTHQTPIREAVELLEVLTLGGQPPHRNPILGDYLDRFTNSYEERMANDVATDAMMQLAFKLLIDLLFYSGAQGAQRLWMLLLDCTRTASSMNSPKRKAAHADKKRASTKMKRPPSSLDESIG